MKEKLIVIIGPTAVGKTSISVEVAKRINGEIISADSMQIYKYMNIGTAKISDEEKENIPHHLIDLLKPDDQEFSVSDYSNRARELISSINNRYSIPIIVGGTGLYVNSVVYDLNFTKVASDQIIRDKWQKLANQFGNKYIYSKLKEIDEKSFEKINLNDTKRIIRAIEIYELTGKPMSEHNLNFRKLNESYDLTMIGLNMDRQKLYDRINHRVDLMIEQGLVEEVKYLMSLGYSKHLISMKAIGYKEIIMYLEGVINLEKAIEIIKKGSRNYAKRQLTWFRRDKRISWFDLQEYFSRDSLVEDIISHINKH